MHGLVRVRRVVVWLAGAVALGLPAGSGPALGEGRAAPAPAAASGSEDVDLVWGLKIPLRDGVSLNGTVYRPAAQSQPLPVIFTLTPYVGDTYHSRALYFARHGYVFVLVDVRGRGDSGGRFVPFVNDGPDGYDVIEFLARQPWSNGKVAMWGGSYAGFDQWAAAKELPPHLATIVPAAAVRPGTDFPNFRGIFVSYAVKWLNYTSGVTVSQNLFGEDSFWSRKFLEMYHRQVPFNMLDRVVGSPSATFQTWLSHPVSDGYWQAMAPAPEQYRQMEMPILTITGAYDGDQVGALSYYREHLKYASAAARARHYLIIGPWDHGGTRSPSKQVGGLEFGDASLLDMNGLHKQWYDWTLKGGARPDFLQQRVAYYVAGPRAEAWKYAGDLDAVAAERRTLYLTSRAGAGDAFHSGTLAPEPRPAPPDRYVYDPADRQPGEGGLEEEAKNPYSSQATVLALHGDGVIYHSDPLAAPIEIAGQVRLRAWLSLDVPDTDFLVNLYEVLADGSSVLLATDQLRARYRESLAHAKPVVAGAVERYNFDGFSWFARRIAEGSRLRLVITAPNTSQLEKNYNSGKPVATESGADGRIAHIAVYHDAEHPSALELPIGR